MLFKEINKVPFLQLTFTEISNRAFLKKDYSLAGHTIELLRKCFVAQKSLLVICHVLLSAQREIPSENACRRSALYICGPV
jgi:hypothetical protein